MIKDVEINIKFLLENQGDLTISDVLKMVEDCSTGNGGVEEWMNLVYIIME